MIAEEIYKTFIHQTDAGTIYVIDPLNPDGLIGYDYLSEEKARKDFSDYIEKENIMFE
jgi:hypothetical protein